jgi:hypothetical protein
MGGIKTKPFNTPQPESEFGSRPNFSLAGLKFGKIPADKPNEMKNEK